MFPITTTLEESTSRSPAWRAVRHHWINNKWTGVGWSQHRGHAILNRLQGVVRTAMRCSCGKRELQVCPGHAGFTLAGDFPFVAFYVMYILGQIEVSLLQFLTFSLPTPLARNCASSLASILHCPWLWFCSLLWLIWQSGREPVLRQDFKRLWRLSCYVSVILRRGAA